MKFKLKIILQYLRILMAQKLKSRTQISDYQKSKLELFAKNVLSKSKYYLPYFNEKKFEWEHVPNMNKDLFMANFDSINTQNITLTNAMQVALEAENTRNFKSEINGITVGLSTGTSGKRGIFLVSEDERALWVALVMHRVIKPKLFKKQKVAFFLRANSNLYSSVESKLFEFKYFDIFKPMPKLLEELNQYQPEIIASQPSILNEIALAVQNNSIQIQPIQIISFAEVLHENDKLFVEQTFNLKIKEVYQCTEGFLGVCCAHGTMHLNEDFVKIDQEWIDNAHFYPIVTDFSRHSQPVVKYKMNDVLKIKKTPCACGSSLMAIEKIIGRDDDVLIFNGIKIFPDLIARRIALKTNAFTRYTITQVSAHQLEIGIECELKDFEILQSQLEIVLNTLFLENGISAIEYVFKNEIAHIQGNKLRKIKRLSYEN